MKKLLKILLGIILTIVLFFILYLGISYGLNYLKIFINDNTMLRVYISETQIKGASAYFSFFLTVLIVTFSLIKLFGKKKDDGVDEHGTAEIGEPKELESLSGDDGFVLSKNVRLSKAKSFEHVAIIGPTGSGKSTSFFIPNLLELDGETSAVVSDPKKEMYELTKDHLKAQGYNVKLIEPFNPKIIYNPLLIAGKNPTEIKEIAQIIMTNGNKSYEMATGASSGNAEWLSMAAPLLTAAMIYSITKGNRKDLIEAKKMIINSNAGINELAKKFKEVPDAYQEFLTFAQASGAKKTMSGIKITLSNALQLFDDPSIKQFISTPFEKQKRDDKTYYKAQIEKLFHPEMLRKEPTVLFVCVPERKALYLMPLMSVFYSQLLNKCMDVKKGNPVLFMLDEFANIGIIPNIANIIATARSREIGVSIGLQGMEQLRRNYGEDNAFDILNNLKTKVMFTGLTGSSAKYVSELAGFTTMKTTSKSEGDDSSSKTYSKQRRELLTPDEVRRLDEDKVLIIAHSKNAVKDDKNSYFEVPKYRKIIKKYNPDWD